MLNKAFMSVNDLERNFLHALDWLEKKMFEFKVVFKVQVESRERREWEEWESQVKISFERVHGKESR